MACVYLLKCEQYYKIGLSDNHPQKRLDNMKTGNPFKIEIAIAYFYGDLHQASSAENELHEYFKSKRIRGEWFKLDENDVAQFHRLSWEKGGKIPMTDDSTKKIYVFPDDWMR